MGKDIFEKVFSTAALRMLPYWRVRWVIPQEETDAMHEQIIKVAPLVYGKTDRNAIQSAVCYEFYRPLEGTPTGVETDTRKRPRPGLVEMSITIPQ